MQAMHGDDGIVLRLPETDWSESDAPAPDVLEAIVIDPDEIAAIVTDQIGGSALFASREDRGIEGVEITLANVVDKGLPLGANCLMQYRTANHAGGDAADG